MHCSWEKESDNIEEVGVTEDMLIWRADTKVEDNKLYMTVTLDNIADYEGKTIVLELREEKDE